MVLLVLQFLLLYVNNTVIIFILLATLVLTRILSLDDDIILDLERKSIFQAGFIFLWYYKYCTGYRYVICKITNVWCKFLNWKICLADASIRCLFCDSVSIIFQHFVLRIIKRNAFHLCTFASKSLRYKHGLYINIFLLLYYNSEK